MKRTGLNTWGSDILLMKPACAKNFLKHLLLLAVNVLSFRHFSYMTEMSTTSLHLWIKKTIRVCFPMIATKTVSGIFHIVEQGYDKSTGTVNKKNKNQEVQWFIQSSSVPYYGTMNIHSLKTH